MSVNGDFGLLVARYDSSLPTLADGQYSQLQVDVNGRLLVQADVTVLVDFLGLNGASDSANILIVGTEDGTSGGTAHAVRLASDGAVMINDNGGSITVDASNLDIRDLVFATDKVDVSGSTNIGLDAATLAALESITVQNGSGASAVNIQDGGNSITVDGVDFDIRDLDFATDSVDVSGSTVELGATTLAALESITVVATDLDIRDLSHTQDSIKIGDGTDFMLVNTDGSINVQATMSPVGSEEFTVSDALAAGGDGLITITATATPWVTVASFSHTSGTAYVYGFSFSCDQNAQFRLITDDGTDIKIYKTSMNSSSQPSYSEHFSEGGRIEIAGTALLAVKAQIKKRSAPGGDALGNGSIHIRK